MRLYLAAATTLLATSAGFASPRESFNVPSPTSSDGLLGGPTNSVVTHAFTGGYNAGQVHLTGTLTAVSEFTYEAEAQIEVTPPSGNVFIIQVSQNFNEFTSLTLNDFSRPLDGASVPAAGTWTFRFFESYNDAGVDAQWENLVITLDDGPPAMDRFVESATDAGSLPGTAQVVFGSGPLTLISGVLNDDEDIYKIQICDPQAFSATTVNLTDIDTRLYIFDSTGHGVVGNDDTDLGVDYFYQSTIANSPLITTAGEYYIAVTAYDHTPTSAAMEMWNEEPYEAVRAPDGPGAAGVIDGWTYTVSDTAPYQIALTGACHIPVPPSCGTADFDGDGDTGTDADIEAFFACLAGNCCATCFFGGSDFNLDGDSGTDRDIESFFSVLSGSTCLY